MEPKEHLGGMVMVVLLHYIKKVKSEVLSRHRSEEDYPVKLAGAVEHLSKVFSRLGGPDGKAEQVLEAVLTKSAWDENKVARAEYHTPDGPSFVFFLSEDGHFTTFPETRQAYLEVLFNLERKLLGVAKSGGEHNRRTEAIDQETFRTALGRAYRRLIKESRGAVYVRIPELFRELGIDKESFDRELLKMRDLGLIILSKHSYAASLSTEDLKNCVEASPGEYYYYVTLREDP